MSTFEEQWDMWQQARAERLEMKDDLDASREVEHFAYFSRRAHAIAAADKLDAAGFKIGLGRHLLKTVLQATRTEALSDAQVEASLRTVIEAVEGAGGTYDGWGAMVQSPAEA